MAPSSSERKERQQQTNGTAGYQHHNLRMHSAKAPLCSSLGYLQTEKHPLFHKLFFPANSPLDIADWDLKRPLGVSTFFVCPWKGAAPLWGSLLPLFSF